MAIDLLFHMNERVHQKTLKIHYFNSLQYFKRSRSGAVTSQSTISICSSKGKQRGAWIFISMRADEILKNA